MSLELGTVVGYLDLDGGKFFKALADAAKQLSQFNSSTKTTGSAMTAMGKQIADTANSLTQIGRQSALAASELNKIASTSSGPFSSLKNSIKQTENELKTARNTIDAYAQGIFKLTSEIDKSKQKYTEIGNKIERYEQQLERCNSMYGESSEQSQRYREAIERLKNSQTQLGNEIENGEDSLTDMRTAMNNAEAEANRLSDSLRSMPFDAIGGKMRDIGQTLTSTVTTGLIAMGTAAVTAATNTEQAMSVVNSILQLNTEKVKGGKSEWDAYSSTLKAGANEIGMAYDEYANAAYNAISASVKQADVTEFLAQADKLATAGLTDLAKATDVLTTIQNAYGMSQKDMAHVSDVLIQTQNKGKITVDELASSMGKIIPTAKSLNVSVEQLGAGYAILTAKGIAGAEATTYMNAMFNELGKSGSKADKILKKLTNKGFADLQKEGKTTADVLLLLNNYAKKNSLSLSDLFGSAEGAKAANVLLGDAVDSTTGRIIEGTKSADSFNQMLGNMKNSAGLCDKAFEQLDNTTKTKLEDALNSAKNMLSDLGEAMKPIISKVAEAITLFMNWASSMIQANPEIARIIVSIGAVVAAIGPLLVVLSALIINIPRIIALFGLAKGAIVSFGATILASPAGIAVLVTAIAGLITMIGDNVNALDFLQDKFGVFGNVLGTICEFIAGVTQMTFGNLLILLKGVGEIIVALLSGKVWEIDDIWGKTWANIENNTAKAMSNIGAETSSALEKIKNSTASQLSSVTSTFDLIMKEWPKLTRDNVGQVASTFAENLQGLDNQSIAILRGTSDSMAVLFEGIYQGMDSTSATEKFSSNLESMVISGKYSTETLQQDIDNAMRLINENVKDSSNVLKQNATDVFNQFKTIAQVGFEGMAENVAGVMQGMDEQTISALASMGGTWSDILKGVATDGSMSAEQMKNAIISNFNSMGIDGATLIDNLRKESSTYWKAMEEEANQAGSEVAKSFDQVPKEVVTTLKNNGTESEEEILKLYNLYQQLPPEVQTYIKTNNMEALTGAQNVSDILAKIPPEIITNILSNVQGKEDVESTQMLLNALPEEERIKIETSVSGKENVTSVKQEIEALPKSANVNTNVNTGDSKEKLEEVSNKTKELNNVTGTLKVDANVSSAASKVSGLKTSVTKDLNTTQANANKSTATMASNATNNFSKMASGAKSGTSKVATTTDADFKKANQSIQQSSTAMYNGAKQSFTKLAQVAKQAGSDAYNGVNTSFSRLAQVVAISMSNAVTAANNSKSKFKSAGSGAGQAWIDGFNSKKSAMRSAVSSVPKPVTFSFRSDEFIESNIKMKDSLVAGINKMSTFNNTSMRGSIFDEIMSTMNSTAKVFAGSVSQFKKAGENSAKAYLDGLSNIEEGLTNTLRTVQAIIGNGNIKEAQEIKKFNKEVKKLQEEKAEEIAELDKEHKKKQKERNEKENEEIKEAEAKKYKNKKEKLAALKKIKDKYNKESVKDQEEYREKLEKINKKYNKKEKEDTEKHQEELQKLREEKIKAERDFNKKYNDIKEDYAEKVANLDKKYIEDQKKLNEEYQKIYNSRVKSLMDYTDLFSSVTFEEIDNDELMENLEEQVDVLRKWDTDMADLSTKVGKDLYEELLAKGPQAHNEIEAINKMSKEQLEEYERLYQEKKKIAERRAKEDTEDEKYRIEKEIEELKKTYDAEYRKLGQEMQRSIEEQIESFKDKFGVVPAMFMETGKDSMQGMIDGIKSMQGALGKVLSDIVNSINKQLSNIGFKDVNIPTGGRKEVARFRNEIENLQSIAYSDTLARGIASNNLLKDATVNINNNSKVDSEKSSDKKVELTLHIEKFINNTKQDIEQLGSEIAFITNRKLKF
ncbi:TPA: phage tail tape measure protein [Clostridioides difficile]